MRPRADQALARTGERGEQVEDRLAVRVGPAAHRVDGAFHRRIVVGGRAGVPVVVAPLVGEPGLSERNGLLEALEPELPPALAHEVGVRRADAHREHRRGPGKKLAAEDAAAVILDVGAVAVCAGADARRWPSAQPGGGRRPAARRAAPQRPIIPSEPVHQVCAATHSSAAPHLDRGARFPNIATPGHSDGHLVLYCAEERLLLCGDTVRSKSRLTSASGRMAAPTRWQTSCNLLTDWISLTWIWRCQGTAR